MDAVNSLKCSHCILSKNFIVLLHDDPIYFYFGLLWLHGLYKLIFIHAFVKLLIILFCDNHYTLHSSLAITASPKRLRNLKKKDQSGYPNVQFIFISNQRDTHTSLVSRPPAQESNRRTSLVNLHLMVAQPNCIIPFEPNITSYIHFPITKTTQEF